MRVPVTTSKKTEIANRRKQVAQLYLNKVKETDIAAKLEVSIGTISGDLKALNKEWQKDAMDDIAQIKARELAVLDFMELDAAVAIQKLKKGKDFRQALKYSDHRLNIIKIRIGMLGLDNPKKFELDANIIGELDGARELLASRIAGITTRIRDTGLPEQSDEETGTSS